MKGERILSSSEKRSRKMENLRAVAEKGKLSVKLLDSEARS